MGRPERVNRPATPTPLTNEGNLCRDRNGDKSGTRGSFDGEAGWERQLRVEKRDAEIKLLRADLKKAKEHLRALEKMAALQQKKWETASEYGKRAAKLQTKLIRRLLDSEDECWLVTCFINGIYNAPRRRRVRSKFQKTGKDFVSLKKTIDDLRHWRRLPREYAYNSDSESDDDSTSGDESDSDSDDIPYRPPAYVLVETISQEILGDAQVFEEFLEENNLIPRYLPSGPYSFESIEQLQMSGQQPIPPVETDPMDNITTMAQVQAPDQEEAPDRTEAMDQKEATDGTNTTSEMEAGIVGANTGNAVVTPSLQFDGQNAPDTADHLDDILLMKAFPEQICMIPEPLLEDRRVSRTPVGCSSGQSDLLDKSVDVVPAFRVYSNTTGENKMEKWREKRSVGQEPGNEGAIRVVCLTEGAGDPGQGCKIGAENAGMRFQAIAGEQPRSTLDEHCAGKHDREGGSIGASSGREGRRTWDNAVGPVNVGVQKIHDTERESMPIGQKAADEQSSGISAQQSIPLFCKGTETREKQGQQSKIEQDELYTTGWLLKRDNEGTYRKPYEALLNLNRRLQTGYACDEKDSRERDPLTVAKDKPLEKWAAIPCRVSNHERVVRARTSGKSDDNLLPCNLVSASVQLDIRILTDEDIRTASEWEPGGTGRIVVRLPEAVTGVRGQKTGATEEDTGIGDWLGERQRASQEVVEEIAGRGWLHTDVRRSGFSFQSSSYGVRWSQELRANGKEIQNLSWSVEVHIATACGVASSWALSESCGNIFCIMYYSRRLWDPGGARLSWHSTCCLRALS